MKNFLLKKSPVETFTIRKIYDLLTMYFSLTKVRLMLIEMHQIIIIMPIIIISVKTRVTDIIKRTVEKFMNNRISDLEKKMVTKNLYLCFKIWKRYILSLHDLLAKPEMSLKFHAFNIMALKTFLKPWSITQRTRIMNRDGVANCK